MRLGDASWPEVDSTRVVVVPVGSCEQHGPHLPLATDSIIAEALAEDLAARRADAVVAPTVSVTASGEHQGFAGTLSVGTEVMQMLVVELVRSAAWASAVVLVNGHGGNAAAVEGAMEQLRGEGRRVLAWWPRITGGDLHAGHTETSLMLAVRPDLVRLDRAVAGPTVAVADVARSGVQALSPTGVLGDPLAATAEHGAELLARLGDDLAHAVDAWLA
ncbi:MAG: mycofactocin biosynthesis peptidyl-dipeptidase MftE [Ilumatobacteraceae bacterium]